MSQQAFGTELEHRLLDAILRDNRQAALVIGRVAPHEFSAPTLGAVFDGLLATIGRGVPVTTVSAADHFEAWGARGIGFADPFLWSRIDTIPGDAPIYADRIRAVHLRSEGIRLASELVNEMRDGALDPQTTLARLIEQVGLLTDASSPGDLETKTLSRVLQTVDTYDWVIPEVLERGDRLVVTDNEGGGKTTFLRQLALCAAGGLHPLDRKPMDPVRVLVIDAENTERQWRRETRWIVNRINQLGAPRNPAEHVELHCTARMDIARAGDMTRIHRLLDLHAPDMVMIGPLYRLVPRAITTDDEAAPLIAALDQIRDRGITLVMEAHAGKANDMDGERDMRPRGSSALMGWPEFGFGLRPLVTDPSMVNLVSWRGGRDGTRQWPGRMYRGGDLPWTPSAI